MDARSFDITLVNVTDRSLVHASATREPIQRAVISNGSEFANLCCVNRKLTMCSVDGQQ